MATLSYPLLVPMAFQIVSHMDVNLESIAVLQHSYKESYINNNKAYGNYTMLIPII